MDRRGLKLGAKEMGLRCARHRKTSGIIAGQGTRGTATHSFLVEGGRKKGRIGSSRPWPLLVLVP